ncbi:MAG: pyridoxal phosphate-dependent aminotransferase [Kistimonas sp.]|nr:pyridoxal phosphate-dependent aminotransferase [Kistimonas sp.]
MQLIQESARLQAVEYAIRGPVAQEAQRLEAQGTPVMHLNIGDPAAFGLNGPAALVEAVVQRLQTSQGYSAARGMSEAVEAVMQRFRAHGVDAFDSESVFIGNGASELIIMATQGLLNAGDEVLIPAPDYPLWTAAVAFAGGRVVHYVKDEASGWLPDLEAMRRQITPRTRAIVVINPNNPTGAVYPKEVLEAIVSLARQHDLLLFADEVYDEILYDGTRHIALAALAGDLPCVTFNSLSKSRRLAGLRGGWMVVSGDQKLTTGYRAGLLLQSSMRLCSNITAQHAVAIALSSEKNDIHDLVSPGGRLKEQRDKAWELLNAIPGVSCVQAQGGLYLFPRLDPQMYPVSDDEQLALELLREEQVLLVHGSGFHWPGNDHFRMVTLPPVEMLEEAIGRLERFLSRRRK